MYSLIDSKLPSKKVLYTSVTTVYFAILALLIITQIVTKGRFGKCGLTTQGFSNLSYERSLTPIGSSAWFAFIREKNRLVPGCLSVIISKDWIISTISCGNLIKYIRETKYFAVYSESVCKNNENITDCAVVIAGAHDILKQKYGTIHHIVDKSYFGDDPNKDIVVFRVQPSFSYRLPGAKYQRGISQICLPEDTSRPISDVVVTGYAANSFWPNSQSDKLTSAKVHNLKSDNCSLDSTVITGMKEYTLCVGSDNDDPYGYTCGNDRAAALTTVDNNRVVLIGLGIERAPGTESMDRCSKFTYYTNIAYFRKWIRAKTGV